MNSPEDHAFHLRQADDGEATHVGRMLVDAYSQLPGMPTPDEQPGYYAMLNDVATRVANPAIEVVVAVDPSGQVVGSVDLITSMDAYGSGASTAGMTDAAGIRLLVVDPRQRGRGIGAALTQYCERRARELGRARVVLHTTTAMQAAWSLYERSGYTRLPAIDFQQGTLQVFGFSKPTAQPEA